MHRGQKTAQLLDEFDDIKKGHRLNVREKDTSRQLSFRKAQEMSRHFTQDKGRQAWPDSWSAHHRPIPGFSLCIGLMQKLLRRKHGTLACKELKSNPTKELLANENLQDQQWNTLYGRDRVPPKTALKDPETIRGHKRGQRRARQLGRGQHPLSSLRRTRRFCRSTAR
ncbi:hypothetical protein GWK47_047414 [Chionoecetes opilio]|uniref:Uncharacterized protein n=1 Tax=Chionoecetes opilio TaxID=41210 RepID=A0A8J5CUE6_CHIOP|nr:hypothetical protein GWK47_047414 [Chionoecetes opilio]